MSDDAYEALAAALDRLPNGFPRTPSNVEIALLKRMYTPEEAAIGGHLTRHAEKPDAIANRAGITAEDAKLLLKQMTKRGLVWPRKGSGELLYRLAPFVVGAYEAQLGQMDHEFAHLTEEYLADGGAAGIMKPQPALHRVMPTSGSVKSEWILPYEDVRQILESARTVSARDCICRAQQDQLGRKCDFELKNCLSFSGTERAQRPGDISRDEALAILDRTEEAGLVHTVSNVMEGLGYICNCCGCCCGILRGITEWGIENSVAAANYYATIDPDECTACGDCLERCQVGAISLDGDTSVIDRDRCIGCGLCVTGCPTEAARLERKPDSEIVAPPPNFAVWEQDRLANRGL